MNELFVFSHPRQAQMAGFRGASMRHPELPRAVVLTRPSDLEAAECLRGVRFDRVFVDSAVPRAHGWKWEDVKRQIKAWSTKPETIWIET